MHDKIPLNLSEKIFILQFGCTGAFNGLFGEGFSSYFVVKKTSTSDLPKPLINHLKVCVVNETLTNLGF